MTAEWNVLPLNSKWNHSESPFRCLLKMKTKIHCQNIKVKHVCGQLSQAQIKGYVFQKRHRVCRFCFQVFSQWWCGGTRSGLWNHRCRSWSRGWWESGRCSVRCCCVPETAGSSSLQCASPSSTGWWCARPAAARSPQCGWTRPESGASVGRSAPLLRNTTNIMHNSDFWSNVRSTEFIYLFIYCFLNVPLTNPECA